MSSGTAIPKQVISMPKVKGLKAIKPKIHTIYPINSSGTTTFRRATDGSDQNTQIVFSIPSYKNSWLNPQRTFLQLNLKTDTGCWATHGAPVFNRLQLRVGNVVVEDIMGLSSIERCLNNFDSVCKKYANSNQSGDFRATPNVNGVLDNVDTLKEIYNNGTTIEKPLISGILGKEFQEHFIPLNAFNSSGGAAMELTLWLEDAAVTCVRDAAGSLGYTMSEVTLSMEVVEMPQALNEKLDKELFNGNAFKLPYSTWRQHSNFLPQNSQNAELSINESATNLETIYTTIRKQYLPPVVDWATVDNKDNLDFLGGHGDRTKVETDVAYNEVGPLKSYQFSYGTDLYPQKRSEMGPRDNKLAYLNAIHSLDKWDADCFAGTMMPDGKGYWDEGGVFSLIQNFKSSRDDYSNGINSAAGGQALLLSLTLKKPATEALRIESFCKSSYQLNIKKGGNVDIINGETIDNL